MKISDSLRLDSSLGVHERVKLSKNTVAIFFVAGILLSTPVWTADRFFPTFPVFQWIGNGASFIDLTLTYFLIASLLAGVIFDKITITRCSYILLVILLLLDQMRWQPWVYLYFIVLSPFAFQGVNKYDVSFLNYLQLLIIGIYFWSGIQKFNQNFIDNTFNNILVFLFGITDRTIINNLVHLGYSIPLIEISIGVLLAIPRFRDLGVFMAILTHLFILAYLSPMGISSNSVVYPWNIAMMALVTFLFFRMKNPLTAWNSDRLPMKMMKIAVIVLIWVLPLFNFANLWDDYLSFSLYSDKVNRYYIAVEEHELTKIDKRLHKYFVKMTGMSGGHLIDVDKWSQDVLNVPFYPERRMLKKLGASFCNLGIEEGKVVFLEFEPPLNHNKLLTFTCKDIN